MHLQKVEQTAQPIDQQPAVAQVQLKLARRPAVLGQHGQQSFQTPVLQQPHRLRVTARASEDSHRGVQAGGAAELQRNACLGHQLQLVSPWLPAAVIGWSGAQKRQEWVHRTG